MCMLQLISVQGPVRDAVKVHGAGVADISEEDLRPVVIKDFQASLQPPHVLPDEASACCDPFSSSIQETDCAYLVDGSKSSASLS